MRCLLLSAELDTTASQIRHGVARSYHGFRDARLRSEWSSLHESKLSLQPPTAMSTCEAAVSSEAVTECALQYCSDC